MSDWPLLLFATLVGVVALLAWGRRRRRRAPPDPDAGVDVLIAAALGIGAYITFRLTHAAYNPEWTPNGQDNHDFFACIVALRFHELESWSPARYPLYPALVAVTDALGGGRLWRVAMEVSLLTSAMLPVAVYVLGRVFAARPVALVGALLTLHFPSHLFMLASPTDYPLAASLYVLSFATLVLMVREGGALRHGVAGVVLALYFLTTPKSFPMLLIGVLALGLGWMAGRRFDLRSIVAFLLPLLLAWGVFAALDVHLFSLEDDMLGVQRAEGWFDPNLPFPDVGWHMNDPGLRGYWVPGTWSALAHLPQVLTYLVAAPVHAMTFSQRLDVFLPQLSAELSMPDLGALVVVSLAGTFGAWRVGAPKARNVGAALLAVLIAGVHLWGQSAAPYAQRYALPVLVTTPVLLLALVALPVRSVRGPRAVLAFLPLVAAAAWVLGPSPGALGAAHMVQIMEPWAAAHPPLAGLPDLRAQFAPGDSVVDASATHLMEAVLDGEPVTITQARVLVSPGSLLLEYPATSAAHQFLVLGCVNEGALPEGDTNEQLRRRLEADTVRFECLDRCTYRDLHPELPLSCAIP